MKKYIITILFISSVAFGVQAQVDRTKAPEAGPAPEIKLEEAETFELKNGLKVFVVENDKLPRIAFNLVLDIEAVKEGDKAGYVQMAGQLLRSGTSTRTKSEIDQEVDFIGATLNTNSFGMYAASLTKHQDKLLEIMTDVLYNPVFPEDEFEKVKKQTLSALASEKDDPSSIVSNVRQAVVYGKDHPYGEQVTEETVNNISVEDCREYYKKYFSPGISYLAIVGDIKVKEAKKLAKKYFETWEAKEVELENFSTPAAPEQTKVALHDRSSSVQSEIRISYPVNLKQGDPDAIKVNVLNQIFGGSFSARLMQNLREDKAYTYGARSSFRADQIVGIFTASASVRNEVTDSSVHEFLYEMRRIIEEDVTESELMAAKASIMGSFARSMENPQTIARFAINTARYNLPDNYYNDYLKKVDALTIEDIRETAKKYIKPENAYVVVVGKGSDVAEGLKKFGPLTYYDIYGNEVDPSKMALPEGLTATKVLNDYIEALGGREKLEDTETLSITYGASTNGMQIQIKSIKKVPGKSMMTVSMAGNPLMVQMVNGEEVIMKQQGNTIPLSEEMKQGFYYDALTFPELFVLDENLETELIGMESIDGQNAYAVEITKPNGQKVTNYYAVDSGLKIRNSVTLQTPQGSMTQNTDFKNYQEVEGVAYPHTLVVPMGPGKLSAEIEAIEINKDIPDETFSVQ